MLPPHHRSETREFPRLHIRSPLPGGTQWLLLCVVTGLVLPEDRIFPCLRASRAKHRVYKSLGHRRGCARATCRPHMCACPGTRTCRLTEGHPVSFTRRDGPVCSRAGGTSHYFRQSDEDRGFPFWCTARLGIRMTPDCEAAAFCRVPYAVLIPLV